MPWYGLALIPASYFGFQYLDLKQCCSIAQGEYMDLATLWDRVNDAINTIIKRDESAETGDYLPPCVEGTDY